MLYRPLYGGNFYVNIVNRQFGQLFSQISEFTKNILHTNIMYLMAAADVNISPFWEKNGGMRLWITKWTSKYTLLLSLFTWFFILPQVTVEAVLKTFKQNADRGMKVLLDVIPRLAKQDWTAVIQECRVN